MTTSALAQTSRSPTQIAGLAVGATFVLVGVLGFIPGVTQNIGALTFADHESEAKLLGLFQVNVLHNIVHVLFGVVGLIASRTWPGARNFLVWGGVVYLGLWLYGSVIDLDGAANFVSLNTADNWLHLGLGVAMIALGLLVPRFEDRISA